MRRSGFGSLVLFTSVTCSVAACGETSARHKSTPHAIAGDGGAEVGGSASGGSATLAGGGTAVTEGGSATAGAASGGDTSAEGGADTARGGEAGAGEAPGGEAGAGGGEAGGGEAGAGGAPSHETCSTPVGLSFLGNYLDAAGNQLWLRDSGKAVTVTRVPVGKPVAATPPALWQVVQACADDAALLLKTPAGAFTRLDYLQGTSSLTVCIAGETAATLELALALPAASRVNTIDSGCNGQPWNRFAKGAL
jgi:hypothetical protein